MCGKLQMVIIYLMVPVLNCLKVSKMSALVNFEKIEPCDFQSSKTLALCVNN